jgi:hypothetical protein
MVSTRRVLIPCAGLSVAMRKWFWHGLREAAPWSLVGKQYAQAEQVGVGAGQAHAGLPPQARQSTPPR